MRRFVKENAIKLTSPQATSEVVKLLRQDFFEHHNMRSGDRFRDSEVAYETALLVLRKRDLTRDEYLAKTSQIPFMIGEISPERLGTIFDANVKSDESVIKPEDLSKFGQEEYLISLEEKFREQALRKASADLEEQKGEVESLRQRYDQGLKEIEKFKSELDRMPENYSLDDVAQNIERSEKEPPKEPSQPWWKEIGLEGDPFPSKLGLTGISKDKYDAIVVQTPFVSNYLEKARRSPGELLGKTILIVGEYGSGKTTLFQYLAASVAGGRILPVNVVLNPNPSVASLTSSMLEQVTDALAEGFSARFGYDPRRERIASDQHSTVAKLFKDLQTAGVTDGFLVMVDGLHKGKAYLEQALEFLQQIQNVQEFFDQQGIRVGFFIAGAPLWELEIERTASLSGSFSRKDVIPGLTEDQAIEAVQKRIKSFLPDSADAITISKDSLQQAYKLLGQRLLRPMTFRDFLEHVRERLESRNYEEVGLSVALHLETIDAVQGFIRGTLISNHYLDLFGEIGDNNDVLKSCQHILLRVLKFDGYSERSQLFQGNRGAFYLLRKHKLIVQRRTTGEDAFKWVLSPELAKSLLSISERLSITPKAALRAAFEERQSARLGEVGRIYAGPIALLREMAATWKDTIPELVAHIEHCARTIAEIDDWMSKERSDRLTAELLRIPVEKLVDAINLHVYGSEIDSSLRWTRFRDSWICPENLEAITKFGVWDSTIPLNETALFALLHEQSRVVSQLILVLSDLVSGEGVVRLKSRRLTSDELLQLHNLRIQFRSYKYREVVDRSSEILESRIRNSIYPALRAIWGDQAYSRLPIDVRTSIEKLPNRGHPRARRGSDVNFLYDVTRSEYSKVVFESTVYKAVFDEISLPREKEDFKNYLELAFSLTDRTAHRDRPSYFSDKATEIRDVLQHMPSMLEVFHKVCDRFISGSGFESDSFGKSFLQSRFLAKESFVPPSSSISIPAKDANELLRLLLERCAARDFPVKDLLAVCPSTTATPEAQLAVLRCLINKGHIEVKRTGFSPLALRATTSGLEGLKSVGGTSGQVQC